MYTSESNYGGGGYESGQSSQAVGGHGDVGKEVSVDAGSGEVDGDEVDGEMQNQMEEEDIDGESGSTDESDEGSEEEELPLLHAWNQDFTNSMNVNDGHDSAWQYHQNNMAKGARYQDKQHLI